jgi:16S rRNA processing protein RimM
VTLGRIVGLYGVRGWVKVHSHTRPPEEILRYHPWQVGGHDGFRELALAERRPHGKAIVARFEGYTDRAQAAELVGSDIAVNASQLPPPKTGEYYWAQLEGLKVVNLAGQELGVVSHLIETGANDVLVVQGERERLIPYTPQAIRAVDLDGGVLRVDWDAEF